jgi:hypothetical protein
MMLADDTQATVAVNTRHNSYDVYRQRQRLQRRDVSYDGIQRGVASKR